MSPQKLLELALLDASGVLDQDESAEFERCFAKADDDLKAQVRREQARFADVSEILPDVSPRPELRALVLQSVREASGTQRDAAGSIILSHAAQDRLAGPHRRRSAAAMGWRISTFAFATAFAAVGVMAFQLNQQFSEVSENIQRNAQIDTLLDLGQEPDFLSALLDAAYERAPLQFGDAAGQASVFFSADEGKGYLALRGLEAAEPGSRYVLVALGDEDKIANNVTRFSTSGETNIIDFDYNASMGTRFAIAVESSSGDLQILFRTA